MSKEIVIPLNGKKLYLATFEFICGEYGQVFEKAFYARDEEALKKKMHEYLFDYYGKGNTFEIDRNVYHYLHGEVAVKNHGWEEITGVGQLVDKLL